MTQRCPTCGQTWTRPEPKPTRSGFIEVPFYFERVHPWDVLTDAYQAAGFELRLRSPGTFGADGYFYLHGDCPAFDEVLGPSKLYCWDIDENGVMQFFPADSSLGRPTFPKRFRRPPPLPTVAAPPQTWWQRLFGRRPTP